MDTVAPKRTSFLTRFFFLWARHGVTSGRLHVDELVQQPDDLGAENWGQKVGDALAKEMQKKDQNRPLLEIEKQGLGEDSEQSSENDTNSAASLVKDGKDKSSEQISFLNSVVLRAFFHVTKRHMAAIFLLFLAQQCLMLLTRPVLMNVLISVVQENSSYPIISLVCAAMFTTFTLHSCLFEWVLFLVHILHCILRAGLKRAVFQKILKISPAVRKRYAPSDLMIILTRDAGILAYEYSWILYKSNTLISIITNMGLMYYHTGVSSCIVSLLLYVVVIGMSSKYTGKQEGLYWERSKARDYKVALVTQMIKGIKAIKLLALEKIFGKRVEAAVATEMYYLVRVYLYRLIFSTMENVLPILMVSSILLDNLISGNFAIFKAETLFSIVIIINDFRFITEQVPNIAATLVIIKNSLNRLEPFLYYEEFTTAQQPLDRDISVNGYQLVLPSVEKQSETSTEPSETGHVISVENATFSWNVRDPHAFRLRCEDFRVHKGSLVAVVGRVGSGKTSLISAILREMELASGSILVRGTTAYVPQEAWILNDTVRENVLFGSDMNESDYTKVLRACELNPDLQGFQDKDLTMLGERGVNMSGGQKQRVCLARAVYSQADIYVLDDTLSAVDSGVGQRMFHQVIGNKGLLRDTTRILVTHGVQWLPFVDVIYMVESENAQEGTVRRVALHEAISEFRMRKGSSSLSADTNEVEMDETEAEDGSKEPGKSSDAIVLAEKTLDDDNVEPEEEDKATAELDSFLYFIRALGYKKTVILLLMRAGQVTVFAFAGILLADWADSVKSYHSDLSQKVCEHNEVLMFWSTVSRLQQCFQAPEDNQLWDINFKCLLRYTALGLVAQASLAMFQILCSRWNAQATEKIASSLLWSVLRSPLRFFEKTAIGKISLRFGYDIHTIGHQVSIRSEQVLRGTLSVAVSVFIVCYACPHVLFLLPPVIAVLVQHQRKDTRVSAYLNSVMNKYESNEVSRAHEIIDGAHVVRAFGQTKRFTKVFESAIDGTNKSYYADNGQRRYADQVVHHVSNLLVVLSALLAALLNDSTSSAASIGLAVAYSLEIGSKMAFVCIVANELTLDVVSMERVMQYINLESEAKWECENDFLHPTWPKHGKVEFRNYSLSYSLDSGPVVKNVSLTVLPGEKIGIVGRTGSGKTSLMLSLFRLVEAAEGAIFIDDVDIKTLGLHRLRSQVAIIPQDPVLFTGTLRSNLDIDEAHSDEEVWDALRHAHMYDVIQSLPGQLEWHCEEGGSNFSMGQRQLLCLARTLLRESKILVLDEATASVDVTTDDQIQDTIRREFSQHTVLTIAHRIRTVMDYDRILVMDSGEVKAFDTPARLRADKSGLFVKMLEGVGMK